MTNGLLAVGLLALLPWGGNASAGDHYFPKNPYDARFCAGLKTEFRPGNASRLDCTSAANAIVVEYNDYWTEAIGQALAFASATGLAPGIVLVCRNDHGHCDNAAAAVARVFVGVKSPLALWDCSITSATLRDCKKLQ